MRSEVHASSREGHHFAEVTAPREAGTADRTPIGTPALLWLEAANSVFKWYGAMLKLAFGLGRIDGGRQAQGLIAVPATVKPEESGMPAEASPAAVAALHSVPTASAKLRPKRRKTASRGKNAARSSKMSSIKRSHRRAA